MLEWLKKFLHLPNIKKDYRNILLSTTLSGLRPTEALQSIKLIKTDTQAYINTITMLLEHFSLSAFFY